MLRNHNGSPAILDPATGKPVAIFANSAAGWSKACQLAMDVKRARIEEVQSGRSWEEMAADAAGKPLTGPL